MNHCLTEYRWKKKTIYEMNKKLLLIIAISVFLLTIVAAVLLLSGPHMRNQPSLRAFESAVNLPAENSVAYGIVKFSPEDIVMPETTGVNLNKGKTYYGYYCIFCHGEDGKGNGPVGQSYIPKPSDLTSDSLQNYSVADLYKHSFTGIGHEPVLERVVPEDFRKFILVYVREEFVK